MKIDIWIVILILIIASVSIFLFYPHSPTNLDRDKTKLSEDAENNSINPLENYSSTEESGSEGGSGGDLTNNLNEIENLPEDLYERDCGFYSKEYEVCAGYCPSGECVQDGKSCYCKNIN